MKSTRTKLWLMLALGLANGFIVGAQSTSVPAPTAYPAFSGFIAERNIFDPNRYPRNSGYVRPTYRPTRPTRSTPTFTLVGTMSYEKGMFAFFDGNNSDLRKVLYQSDTNNIAGYTMTGITLTGVTLQTADKKQTVQMKIGDAMRQAGNTWQLAGPGELAISTDTTDETTPATTEDSSSPSDSSGSANDILKKLMQKREQELK